MVPSQSNDHVELPTTIANGSTPAKIKKRKVQRDSDFGKKQDNPKRRRKESGTPIMEDRAVLTGDKNSTLASFSEPNNHSAPTGSVPKPSPHVHTTDGVRNTAPSSKNLTRSIHKRFGSEDIESNSPLGVDNDSPDVGGNGLSLEEPVDNSGYESEDEAPETVSAAAGRLQSRRAAAEVAKAEERERAFTKAKRRERDARLKKQAKSVRKKRVIKDQAPVPNTSVPDTAPDTGGSTNHEKSKPAKWSIGDPLPEFLPLEVLAAAPEVSSAPVPSQLQSHKTPVKTKLQIFQSMSKPPKVIRRGSAIFQVLEADEGILPPKVSKRGMSVRESWLAGRYGPQGKGFVPRRKMGGSFVRQ